MSRTNRYRIAIARAEARRTAFLASAADAKARVAPARLKSDLKEKLVMSISDAGQSVANTVRTRPVASVAVAATVGAWFARRPIAALFRRLYVRLGHPDTALDNSETDNG